MNDNESELPLAEILQLVALQLGAENVRPGDRLVEDLGAESADVLNLVVALEDRYGIEIAEEELPRITTAAAAHALVRAARAEKHRRPAVEATG